MELLISLLPMAASTGGVALIARLAIKIIKAIPNKIDKKEKELEEQNRLLRERNQILEDNNKKLESKVDEVLFDLRKVKEAIFQASDKMTSASEKIVEEVNTSTTIKNELRTLINVKKE